MLFIFTKINKNLLNLKIGLFDGGENGIRTHERIAPLHAFQACAFDLSATSPRLNYLKYFFEICSFILKTTYFKLPLNDFKKLLIFNTNLLLPGIFV